MEYTSGSSSWKKAVGRLLNALRIRATGRNTWTYAVPAVALVAGVLLTMSANTAAGTALREDRRPELVNLLEQRQEEVGRSTAEIARLRNEIEALTKREAATNEPLQIEVGRFDSYKQAAGLTALHGPGLTVRMDDAPRQVADDHPDAPSNDDLVVHQQDVDAVVNALWAGGAEAITVMGVRVIATTTVRCVGNTLLVDGRKYTPEFVISAIGDPGQLQAALEASDGVRAFQAAVRDYGLGYRASNEKDIRAPAYQGSTELNNATVPE